jgi:hypothetical protein
MLEQIIEIAEQNGEELIRVDRLDDAVIGVCYIECTPKLVYSVSKCLEILEKEMNEKDALEYFSLTVIGDTIGDNAPIWCWDNIERWLKKQ